MLKISNVNYNPSLESTASPALEEVLAVHSELVLDNLEQSIESYTSKMEGMIMMGSALNSMSVISNESGALTEIASKILSSGTDLKGAADFVPSLESYVLEGLEDDSKGKGFLDTAKKVGNAILERIRAMFSAIGDFFSNGTNQVKSLIESCAKTLEKLKSKDIDSVEYELPMYRYNAMVNPMSNNLVSFFNEGYISDVSDLLTADSADEAIGKYEALLKLYLKQLDHIGNANGDTVELDELDTAEILTLIPAVVEDERISVSSIIGTRPRKGEETKSGTLTGKDLIEATGKIESALKQLSKWLEDSTVANKKVEAALEKVEGYVDRTATEIAKLNRFTYVRVPAEIVKSLQKALSDIDKLIALS